MARPRKHPVQLVARMGKPVAPAVASAPHVEHDASHDRLSRVMAVNRHFSMDYALGSAMEALVDAQVQSGAVRRASITKAIRHLEEEIAHLDRQ